MEVIPMRLLLAVFFALALAGCATGPVSLPVDNLAASAQVPLQDLRPAGEGTREIFSLMITNERYGYARLAQDLTEPSGPRLFAHRLQEKYGSSAVPPTKLHHFVVYLNNRSELRTMAVGAGFGGAIGALIASGTVKRDGDIVHTSFDAASFDALSGDSEYKRAFYTDAELKAGTSAFVVFIESEFGGKRRFTRTVSPLKPAQPGEKVPLYVALDAAIQHHLRD
jgi:hypothetical protein